MARLASAEWWRGRSRRAQATADAARERLARIAVPRGAEQVLPTGGADARHAYGGVSAASARLGEPGRQSADAGDPDVAWRPGAAEAEAGPESVDHLDERRRHRASPWARALGALSDHVPPTLRGARVHLTGRAVAGVVVALAVAVGSAALVAGRSAPEMITPGAITVTTAPVVEPGVPAPTEPGSVPTVITAGAVVVHVAGLVATPGVFELPVGSRVVDALQVAGGALPGVDTSTLNLARVLVDGEQIAVGIPAAPDAGGLSPGGGATPGPGSPLDLNTASEAQLDALPGVGPVLAGRIVAWREEHGAFTAIEELLEVSGIGTATLADLTALVRV